MNHFEDAYEKYKQQGTQQAKNEQPTDHSGKEEIIAVRKNEDENIIAIKTSSGRVFDYPTALSDAKAGKLAHVDIFHKYGRDISRSEPYGIKENNLGQQPTTYASA
ncbi:hypothetical protein PB1_05075 [Bacillus methanolicus PB1]|uniref:DUF3892 domain-containing protein n=1 Tax=Bacillus methanolicus PB1 TaxID=997296 RepID=I3E704_BACMT|nr:DUF3892 domain-containing protein [Bacillus methanolicus]EIJ82275.1 hypothetical protein PB1_05075 [Bacillus methanolicus PB1]